MKKIIRILKKYEEIIRYLLISACTITVSLVSYYLLISFVFNSQNAFQLQITNIISWALSVSFAFITNKIFVFRTKGKGILFEAIKFYESRLLTLLIDVSFMFIMVTLLKTNDKIVKLSLQLIIFILNYLFSKFIVFTKNK